MKPLHDVKALNVTRELKGMRVLVPLTGKALGEVIFALIRPAEGQLAGVVLRTPESEVRVLAPTDLTRVGLVLGAAEDALLSSREFARMTPGVYVSEDIVGASVVTDLGFLLGRVSEVYVSLETHLVYYRIVKSEWQRLMGGGFFMAGDVPHSYFHNNRRLIVPADVEGRLVTKWLAETA